jgi:uncharacterized protein with ATP-grasp and redox domains
MNNRPECIPCCLRRVLHFAERSTADEWLHRRVLVEVMQDLARVDDQATPAEVIHGAARKTMKTLGLTDPFLEEKKRWMHDALSQEEWIRSVVDGSTDPFLSALRLAVAANILDCELRHEILPKGFSLKTLVEGLESVPFNLEDAEELRESVQAAESVLFIHDTAGELFFDKLLLEKFKKPSGSVVSVVRDAPFLADATREDALAVGLDSVAQIVTVGIDCCGVPLSACSEEFREHYRKAAVVIAKGQACLETLEGKDSEIDGKKKEIYFLLRVKCPLMARHLGAAVGDSVLETG